ncbi:MAG: hypothetical protein J2P23_06420, partial [Microlunatus sp.]|nr:hypothetical protein [Microlunatus sp.]
MPQELNPWVSRSPATAPATAATAAWPRPTGPSSPQRGVPAPALHDQLPGAPQSVAARLWIVGTHGGAGETALAALSPGWAATDHTWPLVRSAGAAPVLLVARSHLSGLQSAQAAARQWACGLVPYVDVIGLVVV